MSNSHALGLCCIAFASGKANLSWANLSWADLSGANLRGANLRNADLREANLSWANLSWADLREANLSWANLSRADLSDADLRDADLRGADLRNADLREADLSGADLSLAGLSGADLSGANLRNADLRNADLREANLSWANLRNADLSDADLHGTQGIIARVWRTNDPYEFIAVRQGQGYRIKAGCRWFTDTEFRDHVAAEYPHTPKAEETLAILDFIAARAAEPNRAIERAFLEKLRAQERAIRDQAWALESALSLEDKAWAGYRASPTLGDTAWDKEAYAGAVDKAAKDAAVFVLALAAAYARELKDQGLGGLI